MNNDEFTWSKKEKELARKLFDTAYEREMIQIKNHILDLLSKNNNPKDVWKIHDYLSIKREETDIKYDYRYSMLLKVFSILYEENIITDEDIVGFSNNKITQIIEMANFRKNILYKKNR